MCDKQYKLNVATQNSTTILEFRVTHLVVDELHPFVCT